MQKKTLVNNLKTTKKAIVAGKSNEAKVSDKVTPRVGSGKWTRVAPGHPLH